MATGNAVLRAYSRSVKRLQEDARLTAAATSAGFILNGKKGQRTGIQIFVKVIRYSDAKLKKSKQSGGLYARI